MTPIQQEFIELALERKALKFGEFTLKSGRKSPYFFNAGLFNTGRDLDLLGRSYAATLMQHRADFDMLFGPAYKGIPLATVTAAALFAEYQSNVPICYNRKEAKQHGEGGQLVGAPLHGRVMIVDDVITAGTAIRESLAMVEQAGAEAAGVLVALDRQEKGNGELSAIQEIEKEYGIPVFAIVNLNELANFIGSHSELAIFEQSITQYRAAYGISI